MTTITYTVGVAALAGLLFFVMIPSVIAMGRRRWAVLRRAEIVMAGRPSLTHVEWGAAFFCADDAGVASRTREILQQTLLVDVSQIHPEDRLSEDLGLGKVDGLEAEHLLADVEDAFRLTFDENSAEGVETVRDLVRLICAHQGGASLR